MRERLQGLSGEVKGISYVVCGMSYVVLCAGDSGFARGYAATQLGLVRLRLGLRRDKLGLIGFVFLSGTGWFIFVILCGKGGWVSFGVLRIGFVLRKKGRFVEGARQL